MIINAADLFCGAGGSSTGLVKAASRLGLSLELLAVNHWPIAVETHTMNHPWARHLCADLSSVDPSKVIPSGQLRILVASPECTHHSNARGGKPRSDQSRASAWHVLHWAERLAIDDILIENVAEFQSWGPLTKRGKPMKRRKGDTFRAFTKALEAMGYHVDYRVLNAADYGDATTRRRLFIQARRGRRISWPDPSHAGHWRAAREIIDWSLKGESIFSRKRPLKPNTLKRIAAGLHKFGGEPFLAILRGTNPIQSGSWSKSLTDPLGTLTAGGVHMALIEPFLVEYHGDSHQEQKRIRSIDDPLPTQTCENRFGLCQPFIIPMEHSGRQPVRSVDAPVPTITTAKGGSFALCEPFLTKYYGTAKARSVDVPLDTVTVRDRFALCEPVKTKYGLDIRFRMLQPHELAAAMGFESYHFQGTKTDVVKQIGNAVPVNLSAALCERLLAS